MNVRLAVQYAVRPDGVPSRAQFRAWILAALAREAEITLRIVDESEGRQLNDTYRHKDYATNVLTFPLSDAPLIGDIVLCAPVVAQESVAQGKSLVAHYAHLVVHGVLHLQGYDHVTEEDATVMEARETQIVTALGYADPYRITQDAPPHGR